MYPRLSSHVSSPMATHLSGGWWSRLSWTGAQNREIDCLSSVGPGWRLGIVPWLCSVSIFHFCDNTSRYRKQTGCVEFLLHVVHPFRIRDMVEEKKTLIAFRYSLSYLNHTLWTHAEVALYTACVIYTTRIAQCNIPYLTHTTQSLNHSMSTLNRSFPSARWTSYQDWNYGFYKQRLQDLHASINLEALVVRIKVWLLSSDQSELLRRYALVLLRALRWRTWYTPYRQASITSLSRVWGRTWSWLQSSMWACDDGICSKPHADSPSKGLLLGYGR